MSVPKRLIGLAGTIVILIQAGCATPSQTTAAMSLQSIESVPTLESTQSALRPFIPTATPIVLPSATPLPPAIPTSLPTATTAPSPTPLPIITAVPTDIPQPTDVPAAEPQPPTPVPFPAVDQTTQVNGVPFGNIAVLSPAAIANVRAVYERGQTLGRNPQAFSKLGDSLVLTDHYLTRFDGGAYNLGPFAALQPTLDYFAGSWGRYGVATKVGLYAEYATRPGLANADWCAPEEHMMACEFRLHNPSVMLIRVGTNDVIAASAFETALHRIVEYAIESGVIPVLGTKADRFEGDNRNNEIIRKVAADYRIPLWDFDLIADTLPERGLSGDHAHLSVYKYNDYTDPVTLQTGYPVSDLTGLIVLDAVRAAAMAATVATP